MKSSSSKEYSRPEVFDFYCDCDSKQASQSCFNKFLVFHADSLSCLVLFGVVHFGRKLQFLASRLKKSTII